MISFIKYHGTGNDFILIDDREKQLEIKTDEIRKLCDRHFGIGADGLILLKNKSGFDFEMLYFNSDGLTGSMCGNGGRCAVAFAHSLGLIKDQALFSAIDGTHEAKIISSNPFMISLHMGNVVNIEKNPEFIFLNTGSPHYVRFIEDVYSFDVVAEGKKIRYNDRFKKDGTNVNFVHIEGDSLHVRTYERGVEDETLSCGTGVTASVIAAAVDNRVDGSSCRVITPGGKLSVHFKKDGKDFSDVWLEGPAERVFTGEVNI